MIKENVLYKERALFTAEWYSLQLFHQISLNKKFDKSFRTRIHCRTKRMVKRAEISTYKPKSLNLDKPRSYKRSTT